MHVHAWEDLEASISPINTPIRYVDPSAPQTMLELAYQFNYVTTPGYNKIEEGVQYVNQRFHHEKLVISDKCVNLIAQLEYLTWLNPVSKTIKRTEKFGHFDLAFAALRYMVASFDVMGKQEIHTL
jgi:hypothetical protein